MLRLRCKAQTQGHGQQQQQQQQRDCQVQRHQNGVGLPFVDLGKTVKTGVEEDAKGLDGRRLV